MADVGLWTALVEAPHQILGQEALDDEESISIMITNLIAPYYKFKSLTTILICISFIIYVTLVYKYPPFMRIPTFQLEPLTLLPSNLKHYEFYRLFTAPFVYQDLVTLIIGSIAMWSLGSYTQEIMGWKLITILAGFEGLIGFTNSSALFAFLLGCNLALYIMKWPDPNSPIYYRKIMLVVFFISVMIYILLFLNYNTSLKYCIYASTLTGFLLTCILGKQNEANELTTFRKSLSTSSLLTFITVSSILIINLIFNETTLV